MSKDFSGQIKQYRSQIDRELNSLVSHHEPACLYDPVRYVLEGKGKRLRPILLLLVAKMFQVPDEDAMPAALSVEILHNFSLIHDDIMDQDELRHGLPSVYRKWDEATAILAGDVLFAMAYIELAKVETNSFASLRAFNEATVRLCEGQALDKAFESREDVTLNEYMNMVKLKTGTLISLCCRLGAILGNRAGSEQHKLAEFGEFLGQAFQIQDDVLEIFSSADHMGKSLGSDVVSKKKTYLTCRALDKDRESWNHLLESLKGKDLAAQVLPGLRSYFENTGVRAEADEEIYRFVTLSRSRLEGFGGSPRDNLDRFVDMLMVRDK